ncbi:MAG: hypothetical protein M9932_08400 [Xanthobacteraceae bacterium]|nr:hypothetical protein [Xanthobacteraceae bacterium]
MVRRILIACLALALTAVGLSPGHAMRCASDAGTAAMAASAHRHADMADMAEAAAHHAVPDRAVDHGDRHAAAPTCDCGCFSLCNAIGVAPARIEALERRAVDIDYGVVAEGAPDGIPFIDPGIPIREA